MCGADVPGEVCSICGTPLQVAGPTSLIETPAPKDATDPSLPVEAPVVTSSPTLELTSPGRNDGKSGRKWALGGFAALVVVLVAFALFRSSAHPSQAAGTSQAQVVVAQSAPDVSTAASEATTGAPAQPKSGAATPSGPAATSSAKNPGLPPQWVVYVNQQFGFSIPVPGSWKVGKSNSGGAGAYFTSPDGLSRISVVGNPTTGAEVVGCTTVTCAASNDSSSRRAAGATVEYTASGADWYVVSGHEPDGSVYYERTAVGPRSVNTLEIDYPASASAQMSSIVTKVSLGFRPGDLSVSH